MTAVVWLRRDLRRDDLPTLGTAAEAAPDGVAVVFVVDPQFFDPAGPARQGWLARNLVALREAYEGRLHLLHGNPIDLIPALVQRIGAGSVHVSTETEPAGVARDIRVRTALAEGGVAWVETGSPYAVTPGRIRNKQGDPFQVFTPFSRAWRDHGWRAPAAEPDGLRLLDVDGDEPVWELVAAAAEREGLPTMPDAGEQGAAERWEHVLEHILDGYAEHRDRPDLDATSMMSPYLALGVVHPRTLLADLSARGGKGAVKLETELGWREFYADVLHHHPDSIDHDLKPALHALPYDDDPEALEAWQLGRTGYPFVDAGMRQLLATGWMHNRVRMIVASFLTKDLHQWWPVGAAWFERHLLDADVASNAHGWQWTAGTGTDASPYFRVFNPVLQGLKFDPGGAYVRRWVPELAHLPGAAAHEPWKATGGYAHGYPQRIVDHAEERKVALARYGAATGKQG